LGGGEKNGFCSESEPLIICRLESSVRWKGDYHEIQFHIVFPRYNVSRLGGILLKVKKDRIQTRIRESGFVNLRLKVEKGLGGVTALTKPVSVRERAGYLILKTNEVFYLGFSGIIFLEHW